MSKKSNFTKFLTLLKKNIELISIVAGLMTIVAGLSCLYNNTSGYLIKIFVDLYSFTINLIKSNWFNFTMSMLLFMLTFSFFTSLFIKFFDKYILKKENNCNYNVSIMEEFNKIYKQLSDIIFNLSLEGEKYVYKDDPEKYKDKLKELESQDDCDKKVYVVSSDLSLDIYSDAFKEVVASNHANNDVNKKATYKYIVPRNKMVQVPKDVKQILEENKIEIKNDSETTWPIMDLTDIYRFKYFNKYIFENIKQTDGKEYDFEQQYNEWLKIKTQLFLEVDPELFTIFGPSPERTLYVHEIESKEKYIISLFLKTKEYLPSESDQDFPELDMIIVKLDCDHRAHQKMKETIDAFERIWNRYKNIKLDYPIIPLLDVPHVLEDKADEIWVLSPNLVFDNTYVPIRYIVKQKIERSITNGNDLNYKFIIPYSEKDEIISKNLSVFFKIHGVKTIYIQNFLDENFVFVASENLIEFSLFGEIALYKIKSNKIENNTLCLFPPVKKGFYSSISNLPFEIDTIELDNEFVEDKITPDYADFALILSEKFRLHFEKLIKKIISKNDTISDKKITYYNCKFDKNKSVSSDNFVFEKISK